MDRIIKKYIEKMDNGLFLLDANTGSGKTEAVLNYMFDSIENNPDEKIIFITNLKTNLPHDRFIKLMEEDNFKKHCLILKPFWEMVVDNILDVEVPDPIKDKCNEYKQLIAAVKKYNNILDKINSHENNKNDDLLDFLLFQKDKIENIYEKDFRNFIKTSIIGSGISTERYNNYLDNEWIGKIYESVKIDDYKIIFMSTSKFLSSTDRIFKTALTPYLDSTFLKNKTIFIDEFDSTKKVFLNHIISQGVTTKVNVISLFLSIYYNLTYVQFPSLFEKIDEYRITKNKKGLTIKDILNFNRNDFFTIYNEEKLEYLFKSTLEKSESGFLFKDDFNLTITKETGVDKIYRKISKESNYNELYYLSNKQIQNFEFLSDEEKKNYKTNELSEDEKNSKSYELRKELLDYMENIIFKITNVINFFTTGVAWISMMYYEYKNETSSENSYLFTKSEAVYTILNTLNLGEEFNKYLYDNIIKVAEEKFIPKIITDENGIDKINEDKKDKVGYKFLEFSDSGYHDLQTLINLYKFENTPEKIMIHITSHAKTIGISATATLPTIINNYNLDVFKKELKNLYFTCDNEDISIIKDIHKVRQGQYENDINIDVQTIDFKEEYIESLSKEILKVHAKDFCELFSNNRNDKKYYQLQTLKLLNIYKEFSDNETSKSFLVFINSIPKYNANLEIAIDKKILNDYFEVIDGNISVYYISSSNYEYEMNKVREDLSKGKKCMVITTYQTIGAGKNIQYVIPSMYKDSVLKDKTLNEKYVNNNKDFDSIYLSKPTHITQILYPTYKDTYDELARYLFQLKFLRDAELIDDDNFKNSIKKGFKMLHRTQGEGKASIKATKDNDFNMAGICVQAVGRICRCTNKNKNISIYIDQDFIESVQKCKEYFKDKVLNIEFKKILDYKVENKNKLNSSFIKDICVKNNNASSDLTLKSKQVRNKNDNRKEWVVLGEFALMNPTTNIENWITKKYYIPFEDIGDKLYYRGHHEEIFNISFDEIEGYQVVSDECLSFDRLPKLVKEEFISKYKYPTKFKKAKYIMSPAFFNQIYKGRFGEIIGKITIEQNCNIRLEDIKYDKEFEVFDYQYSDSCYIDFKFMKYIHMPSNENFITIKNKLNSINGRKVILINLFEQEGITASNENKVGDIYTIPALYDSNFNIIRENINFLKSCLYETRSIETILQSNYSIKEVREKYNIDFFDKDKITINALIDDYSVGNIKATRVIKVNISDGTGEMICNNYFGKNHTGFDDFKDLIKSYIGKKVEVVGNVKENTYGLSIKVVDIKFK